MMWQLQDLSQTFRGEASDASGEGASALKSPGEDLLSPLEESLAQV